MIWVYNETRMWNMISSPATPTVCQIFKVATWHYRCRHHLKNNCICNVAYYSAAKITFPIAQSSNKATKCGIRGYWKLKVKPNLGCCSNIAIYYLLHFSFCFVLIIPRLTELWPIKCQGHPLSLWCWPLTCNLEKCYSLRSCFGMYNLER